MIGNALECESEPRVLVAGIGNIFLGDDAFGVEVVKRLAGLKLPDNVRVVDFGIRGFDLTYALLDGYDEVILIDAIPRGEKPGTLYVIEPDLEELADADAEYAMIETHGMNPLRVLRLAISMGGQFKRIILVGCEPAMLGSGEEGHMGLSEPVEAAVGEATKLIKSMLEKVFGESDLKHEDILNKY